MKAVSPCLHCAYSHISDSRYTALLSSQICSGSDLLNHSASRFTLYISDFVQSDFVHNTVLMFAYDYVIIVRLALAF